MAEAARVQLAASASGKNVYPVFQYRWGTPMAQLKALVASGLAGRPIIASLETHWSRDSDYYAVPWRGTWSGELGGAVLGHAIHSHDLLCFVMGPVDCLSAMTSTRVNPIETEDCAAISFRLQNGALATSNITLGAARNETRLRFVFENLTATSGTAPYAPASQPWSFLARRADMQPSIDDALSNIPEQQVGFLGFLEEVARDMAEQASSVVTLGEACASIELATAIYHAARTGLRVSLPLGDQHPLHEGWLP
jgi:predicted dehydrogenase